jgi:hypothetical protein
MNKLLNQPLFNGLMLGLILPITVFLIWHEIKYESMSFEAFIRLSLSKVQLPATIRMCVFVNLPFFLLFNIMKRFEVCMGIFISSMLYIIVMFGLYWLG